MKSGKDRRLFRNLTEQTMKNRRGEMKSSKLFWRRFDLKFEFFYIQSSPFFLVVYGPFIGRVDRYTPSSRSKNASKTKAISEFHKCSDDFDIFKSTILFIPLWDETILMTNPLNLRHMFDFLKVLIGSLAILFIGNAVLGSDRLWVYMDYSAISEQKAMDSSSLIQMKQRESLMRCYLKMEI